MNKRVARFGDGHAEWEKPLGFVSNQGAADTLSGWKLKKRVARSGDGQAVWEKPLGCVSDQDVADTK